MPALVGGCILAAGLAGQPDTANAQSGFTLHGRERAHCKLSNVAAGQQLYNGTCIINQATDGTNSRFSIKMGSSEPFVFATHDGVNWMSATEKVRFRDRGHTGIFRWSNFRLEVDED